MAQRLRDLAFASAVRLDLDKSMLKYSSLSFFFYQTLFYKTVLIATLYRVCYIWVQHIIHWELHLKLVPLTFLYMRGVRKHWLITELYLRSSLRTIRLLAQAIHFTYTKEHTHCSSNRAFPIIKFPEIQENWLTVSFNQHRYSETCIDTKK